MYIPKNTLLRDKAKKILSDEGLDLLIEKMENKDPQTFQYRYRRRLNQMIKKRVDSMLKGNILDITEVADLLDLVETRMLLDGNELKSAMIRRMTLKDEYGSYTKGYTNVGDIDSEQNFAVGYTRSGKIITDQAHKAYIERAINEEGK